MSTATPHHDPVSPLVLRLRRRWRWLVPLIALAVFAGAGGVISALTNAADAALKPRSVSQLIMDVKHAQLASGSGTIVQTSDLGLPALPDFATGNGSNLVSLLSGTHTLRFWYGGPGQLRLAMLSQFGETDLIHNGQSLWQWTSSSKSATEYTLPKGAEKSMPHPKLPAASATPPEAAKRALANADKSTSITAGGTTTVAGRKAYQLIVTPRRSTTLIKSVQIAIDGSTHIPTRVSVYAKNHSGPVFEVAFSSFNTGKPPASVFAFNPPPGTKVTRKSLSDLSSMTLQKSEQQKAMADHGKLMKAAQPSAMKVVGEGWGSVLVAKAPNVQSLIQQDKTIGSMMKQLPAVSGSWGSGHLFRGTAFSAVITDDGRVAVGAVPPSVIYSALMAK